MKGTVSPLVRMTVPVVPSLTLVMRTLLTALVSMPRAVGTHGLIFSSARPWLSPEYFSVMVLVVISVTWTGGVPVTAKTSTGGRKMAAIRMIIISSSLMRLSLLMRRERFELFGCTFLSPMASGVATIAVVTSITSGLFVVSASEGLGSVAFSRGVSYVASSVQ